MPTDRFYHLPIEKRASIRQAAVSEFARVPLEQVSINKIVKAAGISRGSFYTYFEDKRDVMIYLMEETRDEMEQSCIRSLKTNGGDYFKMLEDAFCYVAKCMKAEENIRLWRNMFLNSDILVKVLTGELQEGQRGVGNRIKEWFFRQADAAGSAYRQPIHERFELLMEVTTPLVVRSALEYCCGDHTLEEARRKFKGKLDLLKCIIYP